jgi:hypothetical protein
MMSSRSVWDCRKTLTGLLVYVSILLLAPVTQAAELDPFMGDWQGEWELDDGSDWGPLVAQVICWGKGAYQANVQAEFDQPWPPIAILQGQLEGGTVPMRGRAVLSDSGAELDVEASITAEKLHGKFKDKETGGQEISGKFELKKTARRSPTLGAKPPAGAIVLFDGTDFDQWLSLGGRKGAINIAEAVGSVQNAVAYLKAKIWSRRERSATLLLGSDDGVKVWLNDKLVHANNALRGVSPDQDKVDVTLQKGANELLLKITNGGGDWGAIARFAGAEGKPLRTIREVSPQFASETGSNEYLRKNNGFLTQWQVAGPYRQGDEGPEALFDVAFAPEQASAKEIDWKWLNANEPDDSTVKWRLVERAMEAGPGTGSIVTKKKFKDFKLHIEFRTPFMPDARGQGRGNSGVYLQGRYEVQVLDSYGLEPKDNECGGIYKVGVPMVNMCLPPMQWQTYDITFRGARLDQNGGRERDAYVTVLHNGVTIHDERRIPGPTGGALDSNVSEPGGLYLQDHGNPVQLRNIWLVEQK